MVRMSRDLAPYAVLQRCSDPRNALWAPTAFYIKAVYKKLTERRDTAEVTELLKELHRIAQPGRVSKAFISLSSKTTPSSP